MLLNSMSMHIDSRPGVSVALACHLFCSFLSPGFGPVVNWFQLGVWLTLECWFRHLCDGPRACQEIWSILQRSGEYVSFGGGLVCIFMSPLDSGQCRIFLKIAREIDLHLGLLNLPSSLKCLGMLELRNSVGIAGWNFEVLSENPGQTVANVDFFGTTLQMLMSFV